MKAILEGMSFLIVIFFGLFGAIAFGVVLHEYSHALDFSKVASNSQICALSLPTEPSQIIHNGLAYYSFEVEEGSREEAEARKIGQYTEFKAYSITIAVLILFVICLEVVFRGVKGAFTRNLHSI
ncbi:MAG: hypothetical protein Q8Q31_03335 [Nanoarchaeota archaeon]|nr:hypothetical protein [Nanoarchaeota archaeon]